MYSFWLCKNDNPIQLEGKTKERIVSFPKVTGKF